MVKLQKTQTMERLKNWQARKDEYQNKTVVLDRRRLHLSNKFTKDQSDEITLRRQAQMEAEGERHRRMVEKIKLEKLFV